MTRQRQPPLLHVSPSAATVLSSRRRVVASPRRLSLLPQDSPFLHATTRIVALQDGELVHNLTAADFRVYPSVNSDDALPTLTKWRNLLCRDIP